jgi:ABC-type nitrate/sulfonate/bicarbonate transport system ATPase subunit
MKPSSLIVQGLSYTWSKTSRPVFQDVSFKLSTGNVLAIMGANGTGKTTLLEVISGRLPATSGTVLLDERNVLPESFNYLPQDSSRLLFSHLTLSDNLAIRRKLNLNSSAKILQQLFEDDNVLSHYPEQYSGGQRQRATVCRAVLDIPNFPVTLLDESFSQLSRDAKAIVGPILGIAAKETGAMVVFVSHDLFDAMRYGDKILILADGKTSIFDTSDIDSEDDCWRESSLRDKILLAFRQTKEVLV